MRSVLHPTTGSRRPPEAPPQLRPGRRRASRCPVGPVRRPCQLAGRRAAREPRVGRYRHRCRNRGRRPTSHGRNRQSPPLTEATHPSASRLWRSPWLPCRTEIPRCGVPVGDHSIRPACAVVDTKARGPLRVVKAGWGVRADSFVAQDSAGRNRCHMASGQARSSPVGCSARSNSPPLGSRGAPRKAILPHTSPATA